MIDALRNGYVIYIQHPYISGVKNENGGVELLELPKETMDTLSLYPRLLLKILDGSLVQISCEGLEVVVIVGTRTTEGPYCETECLDVLAKAADGCLFTALDRVEKELALIDKKATVRQRLYRPYAADRFSA